jgi:hypothetical protein
VAQQVTSFVHEENFNHERAKAILPVLKELMGLTNTQAYE